MRANEAHRPNLAESAATGGYWLAAKRPLQILLFLLPPIIGYELCLALLLRSDDGQHVRTVEAHSRLLQFFHAFDIGASGGLYLGGIVIVVVLLSWHLLVRDRWHAETRVVGLMALESIVLAIPLLVLGSLISQQFAAVGGAAPPDVPPLSFDQLSMRSKMAISVGAGLYEELAFRMVLIAIVHTLLVDLARLPHRVGASIAILISAVAFTVYHDLGDEAGRLSLRKALFYFLAGVYFGVIYLLRGFGIVVGVHATYDVITVLLSGGET